MRNFWLLFVLDSWDLRILPYPLLPLMVIPRQNSTEESALFRFPTLPSPETPAVVGLSGFRTLLTKWTSRMAIAPCDLTEAAISLSTSQQHPFGLT